MLPPPLIVLLTICLVLTLVVVGALLGFSAVYTVDLVIMWVARRFTKK